MFLVSVENSRSMGVKEVLYERRAYSKGYFKWGSVEISRMVAIHGKLSIN